MAIWAYTWWGWGRSWEEWLWCGGWLGSGSSCFWWCSVFSAERVSIGKEKLRLWLSAWCLSSPAPVTTETVTVALVGTLTNNRWVLTNDRTNPVRKLSGVGIDTRALETSTSNTPRGNTGKDPASTHVGIDWADKWPTLEHS